MSIMSGKRQHPTLLGFFNKNCTPDSDENISVSFVGADHDLARFISAAGGPEEGSHQPFMRRWNWFINQQPPHLFHQMDEGEASVASSTLIYCNFPGLCSSSKIQLSTLNRFGSDSERRLRCIFFDESGRSHLCTLHTQYFILLRISN